MLQQIGLKLRTTVIPGRTISGISLIIQGHLQGGQFNFKVNLRKSKKRINSV